MRSWIRDAGTWNQEEAKLWSDLKRDMVWNEWDIWVPSPCVRFRKQGKTKRIGVLMNTFQY